MQVSNLSGRKRVNVKIRESLFYFSHKSVIKVHACAGIKAALNRHLRDTKRQTPLNLFQTFVNRYLSNACHTTVFSFQ
jgi:hypothetical protein